MDFVSTTLPLTALLFVSGMVLSLVTAPFAIKVATHFGIIDMPGRAAHKQHERPTPLAGGMVVASCLLILYLIFGRHYSFEIQGILASVGIIFVFGLVDDIRGLNAQWKFSGQIIASIVLIASGTKIAFISFFGPSVDPWLNILLTVLWLVGVCNAFNLVDSADALSLSLGGVASGLLIFASMAAHQEELTFQAGALLGVILGLMAFNLQPARLFMGDSGSQSMGFFLAALAIHYLPEGRPQASSWFVPITLVAVPIFDVCLVFISRLRQHKPFYESDLKHTYHRLRALGFSHLLAVWVMDLAALLVGGLGVIALFQPPQVANLVFAVIVLTGAVLILFASSTKGIAQK
ncbi:MAG: undecaprenyl/decaprenyl-phosphate alpha-N-acetylglucosaminyl 1-phosphate transferase [Anaerolineales bacterium]|nr:MAG: undecaprenyl/decaprenyl-phosphate alpha-N-acetylglucosaminyl 1-phosphate transferase [Anaerolineales bacterium]